MTENNPSLLARGFAEYLKMGANLVQEIEDPDLVHNFNNPTGHMLREITSSEDPVSPFEVARKIVDDKIHARLPLPRNALIQEANSVINTAQNEDFFSFYTDINGDPFISMHPEDTNYIRNILNTDKPPQAVLNETEAEHPKAEPAQKHVVTLFEAPKNRPDTNIGPKKETSVLSDPEIQRAMDMS